MFIDMGIDIGVGKLNPLKKVDLVDEKMIKNKEIELKYARELASRKSAEKNHQDMVEKATKDLASLKRQDVTGRVLTETTSKATEKKAENSVKKDQRRIKASF